MAKYYFSRSCESDPHQSAWLVAGVIDAESVDDAKAQFDEVMRGRGRSDRSSMYSFIDLDSVKAAPAGGGLLAITMGGY